MRLNLGCGAYPLRNWTNIDSDPTSAADVFAELPPLPYHDECIEEIYAGHFLEHLDRDQAAELLQECWRVLVPGGRLGVVVPDTREIMRRYLSGESERFEVPLGQFWRTDDLDAVCSVFIYSTIQDTPHKWMYDETTLAKTIAAAGFRVVGRIDGWRDPRIPCGAWWNLGLDAIKPPEAS